MLNAIIFLILGLVLLVYAADYLVKGASQIATDLGISPLVVGLTVVAFGTSAPELAVSIMSAFRGEADLALGNVVGSNIFNILVVLGLSSIIAPSGVAVDAAALKFDIPVMIGVAIACLPIFFHNHMISRTNGVFFFLSYVAYVAYLISTAGEKTASSQAASTSPTPMIATPWRSVEPS